MKISSRPPLLPPKATSAKLFLVGSTIGPIVDSLHNQCLLEYDIAPIVMPNPLALSATPLFCSSWAVPPLLGIAYLVLGYILPRLIELLIGTTAGDSENDATANDGDKLMTKDELKNRAILAVTSTALIIKLSDYLQTHDAISFGGNSLITLDATTSLGIMTISDIVQWMTLDRTSVALVAAAITAIGGPLSELPFVANGFWHYLPQSADYLPLSGEWFQQQGSLPDVLATKLLGNGYNDLALSSITGPCYFAVTMNAIALGRYFYRSNNTDELE